MLKMARSLEYLTRKLQSIGDSYSLLLSWSSRGEHGTGKNDDEGYGFYVDD
jgi:hypothetical protein